MKFSAKIPKGIKGEAWKIFHIHSNTRNVRVTQQEECPQSIVKGESLLQIADTSLEQAGCWQFESALSLQQCVASGYFSGSYNLNNCTARDYSLLNSY